MIQTTTLNVRVFEPSGVPAEGATVRALLQHPGVAQDGYVDRSELSATSDESGTATLQIWPNTEGLTDAQYRIVARGSDGRALVDELVSVPVSEVPVWLHDIVMLPAPTAKPYDEASITAIQQARILAQDARIGAEDAAAEAKSDRQTVGQKAQEVELARQAVESLEDSSGQSASIAKEAADGSVALAIMTASDRTSVTADRLATEQARNTANQKAQEAGQSAAAARQDAGQVSDDRQAVADDRAAVAQLKQSTADSQAAAAQSAWRAAESENEAGRSVVSAGNHEGSAEISAIAAQLSETESAAAEVRAGLAAELSGNRADIAGQKSIIATAKAEEALQSATEAAEYADGVNQSFQEAERLVGGYDSFAESMALMAITRASTNIHMTRTFIKINEAIL
jgi:hypothetical protein